MPVVLQSRSTIPLLVTNYIYCICIILSIRQCDSLVIPSSPIHQIYRIHDVSTKTTTTSTIVHTTTRKSLSSLSSFCLYAIGGGNGGSLSNRENEIRRKIKSLKKQGYIKNNKNKQSDNIFDGMDDDIDEYDDNGDDDKSQNNNKVTDSSTKLTTTSNYSERIRIKLGPTKSKILGFTNDDDNNSGDADVAMDNEITKLMGKSKRIAQIGSLQRSQEGARSDDDNAYTLSKKRSNAQIDNQIDNDNDVVGDDEEDEDEDSYNDQNEQDLLDLVAIKMQEKRDRENRERLDKLQQEAKERLEQLELERQEQQQKQQLSSTSDSNRQLTSGVGGSWTKPQNNEVTQDIYQPKTGSWGAFPRPRDISKAYGGGRQVGVASDDAEKRKRSEEETRERLKNYRVKMGIDYEAETIHADEINEALSIAGIAMQRGIYSTAVSALEKVTRYCSTNSKVGGKVFLELAMAYEAVGRTKEAITVYSTLSRSRIEKIKINAKRLLYGIEAMQFMQETVRSEEFSRKKASATFIDTTGLANIASKFDDRYETAYVDLSSKGNYYKRLTESVVRSPREARQILLLATGPGEVDRLRIVQACRSLNRRFDETLQEEIDANTLQEQDNVAIMNGKPILQREEPKSRQRRRLVQQRLQLESGMYDDDEDEDDAEYDEELDALMLLDEYVLKDATKMRTMLAGEWKLQLLADKRGDGVKFFNTSNAWQSIDMDTMSFTAAGPLTPFLTVQKLGNVMFNDKLRIVRRTKVATAGPSSWFTELLLGNGRIVQNIGGPMGAIRNPQQIVLIDSVLLVTRNVPSKLRRLKRNFSSTSTSSTTTTTTSTSRRSSSDPDDEKDYFAVWRRVERGTYSS